MDQRKSVHIMHLPFIWLKLGELNPTIHLFETTKKQKSSTKVPQAWEYAKFEDLYRKDLCQVKRFRMT